VTGDFQGTVDFDPGPGVFNLTSAVGSNAFVAKYSSSGTLVWARQVGGAGGVRGHGVAVDGSGNVYAQGVFGGRRVFGGFTLTSAGGADVYVSKLDGAGNFLWARRLGGTDNEGDSDAYVGFVVDGAGNCYPSAGRLPRHRRFRPRTGHLQPDQRGATRMSSFASSTPQVTLSGHGAWAASGATGVAGPCGWTAAAT